METIRILHFSFILADRLSDNYGSGYLMRGVLLHFLKRYDEAHESLDRVLSMFVESIFIVKSK